MAVQRDVSNAVLVAGTSGNCASQLKEEIEATSNRQRNKQSVSPEVGNRQPENVRDPDRSNVIDRFSDGTLGPLVKVKLT
jgi:hypothetical protein